jgi:hypothetical protein
VTRLQAIESMTMTLAIKKSGLRLSCMVAPFYLLSENLFPFQDWGRKIMAQE